MFYLKKLKLNSFRCYKSLNIDFLQGINILCGPNASGKTSIVESISYLGLCKSFKNSKDEDILNIGSPYFYVNGEFVSDNSKETVTISLVNKVKTIKKNSNMINKLSDYIGFFNVITFNPDDLEIIKGSPSERRRFLNINISQSDKKYVVALSRYNKILKIRNDYLKNSQTIDKVYLEAITKALIEEGKTIINIRNTFVDTLNPYINGCLKVLSSTKEEIKIVYKPNSSINEYEEDVLNKINTDVLYKTSTVGPHKDDFKVFVNGNDVSLYGSQGQIRSAVISLKLGLSRYYNTINDKQIIILDDVLSELDEQRQEKLLELLDETNQIFITTTSVESINKQIIEKSNLIKIGKEG